MNQIKITVSGMAGAGKTSIANYIRMLLLSIGFTNTHLIDPDAPLSLKDALKNITFAKRDNFQIVIETKQLKRDSVPSSDIPPSIFDDSPRVELGYIKAQRNT